MSNLKISDFTSEVQSKLKEVEEEKSPKKSDRKGDESVKRKNNKKKVPVLSPKAKD